MKHNHLFKMAIFFALFSICGSVFAHHVLGRPAYSLNEDSNTPSSVHVETQVGDYFVTYMIFPAFPRPDNPGRINLYAKRIDNGAPFSGEVTFTVEDDTWFGGGKEHLGTQSPDDTVFRQGFTFKQDGSYIITARFEEGDEHYEIGFPLQVGEKSAAGLIGIVIGGVLIALIGIKLIQRKRLLRETIRNAHQHTG